MQQSHSTAQIDWASVAALFEQVGWGQRDPVQIRAAFETSSHVIFLHDGHELVGFGRTVNDGCYYALLVNVVVKPTCQGRGIGRIIVEYLKAQLRSYRFVTLTAAPGKEAFYRKLGWQPQQTALIWPMSDTQRSTCVAPIKMAMSNTKM